MLDTACDAPKAAMTGVRTAASTAAVSRPNATAEIVPSVKYP